MGTFFKGWRRKLGVLSLGLLPAAIGATLGYLCFVFAANVEGFQFYTIRSTVTGRAAMADIVQHPADRFVWPVLLGIFVGIGAVIGIWSGRLYTPEPPESP